MPHSPLSRLKRSCNLRTAHKADDRAYQLAGLVETRHVHGFVTRSLISRLSPFSQTHPHELRDVQGDAPTFLTDAFLNQLSELGALRATYDSTDSVTHQRLSCNIRALA